MKKKSSCYQLNLKIFFFLFLLFIYLILQFSPCHVTFQIRILSASIFQQELLASFVLVCSSFGFVWGLARLNSDGNC